MCVSDSSVRRPPTDAACGGPTPVAADRDQSSPAANPRKSSTGPWDTPERLTHPKYRPDIDGLRAVAVLSVVSFHAFPSWVKGGLVGVDIFFVISGFLISTIIYGSLQRNAFSFIEFYSRRIKRIFPALAVILIASFAFGWFALFADEYKQLGKHIAAGAGFASNFVLWSETGYFDNAAETKPMLHLWSLGIEEQFYIFWPLILWFAWKRHLNLLLITFAFGAISFVLNVRNVYVDPTATFFSPQTRFWELAAGSILAYVTLFRQDMLARLKLRSASVQSFLGAVLVAVAVFGISRENYFPGWWAVPPTLGAALMISAGPGAWLNRTVLSHRVMVWFGVISYPLYLWHWPLLSFATIVEDALPPRGIRIGAVVLSVILAWLTYTLVEARIRFSKRGRTISLYLLALMATAGCVGYYGYARDGFDSRAVAGTPIAYDGDVGYEIFHEYPYTSFPLCTPIEIRREAPVWDGFVRCLQSKPGEVKDIAIIGDSHAEHLFLGLAQQLPDRNVVFYIQNSLPVARNGQFERIFRYVLEDRNIRAVILTAYWHLRMDSSTLEAELLDTVKRLRAAGKTVYITDDVPNFSFGPKKCKYESNWIRTHRCTEDRVYFQREYERYVPILERVQESTGASILRTAKYFCSETSCSMEKNGDLLYRDDNHLNVNGSKYLGRMIVEDYPVIAEMK